MNLAMRVKLGFTASACALVAAMLLGCIPIVDPSGANDFNTAAGEAGKQGLLIHFGGKDDASRTVFPTAPTFTKYAIAFASVTDGSGDDTNDPTRSHDSVEITGGLAYIEDLAYGWWKITVTGYIEGNHAAAAGDTYVNYSQANTSAAVTIQSTALGDGYFVWDLDFSHLTSGGGPVNNKTGSAALYEYRADGNYNTPIIEVTLTDGELNGGAYNTALSPVPPLAAGYYYMLVKVSNGYHTVVKDDAVWIHGNLTTKAAVSVADSEFTPLKSITGTITNLSDYSPGPNVFELVLLKNNVEYAVVPIQNDGSIVSVIPASLGGPVSMYVHRKAISTDGEGFFGMASAPTADFGSGSDVVIANQNIIPITAAISDVTVGGIAGEAEMPQIENVTKTKAAPVCEHGLPGQAVGTKTV
jgi:hypothetical protein